jgi:L-ascorbate metabolism protein UlaG (beta-lactamase superfamily)
MASSLSIRVAGGPTAVLEYGGLRLVTDPTFDSPRAYPRPNGPTLTKIAGSAFGPGDIGPADAVLLSHDQHADNLDLSGHAYLEQVPLTLTTPAGAARLGGSARGLMPWDEFRLGDVLVTAVPARHGPEGAEAVSGEVTGFVLTGDGLQTVYISGDNAWLGAVDQVAGRFGPVDVAMLFAGAVRLPERFGDELLTIDSPMAAQATTILGAAATVPVHFNGWAHFAEGGEELRKAFADAGLSDRLVLLEPGDVRSL